MKTVPVVLFFFTPKSLEKIKNTPEKSKIFKNSYVLKYAQIFILKSNVTHVFKCFWL